MHRTAGGTTSQLLTGGVNSRVGAARSIKVYPGDKVKAEVYAKYWDLERTGQMGDIVASLVGAFGLSGEATGEMLKAYTGLSNAGAWMTGDGRDEDEEEGPKGFVTVLLFDKDYNFVDAGWDRLDEAYTQDTDLLNNDPFDHLEVEVTVKREGYAYIFVSNEHPSQLDIHFDDFKVTHTPLNVVQYNEYYPYGLKAETSWTREDAKGNNYLFNAGNELNEASGWYEMFYRGYDPALGRMLQVDPLAGLYSSLSGYNYALNNPVLMNDPMGDRVESQLPDYVDWSNYNPGAIHVGPGSGNHWSDSYRGPEMNLNFMSTTTYGNFYGVDLRSNLGKAQVVAAISPTYTVGWDKYGGEEISREEWLALGGDPSKFASQYFPGAYELVQMQGGTLYSNETEAYNFMWNNSFRDAGDKVKAEVYAKYWDLERTGQMGDIVASLVGAFGLSGEATGEMLKAYTGLSNAGAWMTGDGRDEDEEEGPKGFVTVLLFDKDYNFIDAGWDRLDEAYTQDTDLLNNDPFDRLEVEVTVKREGYAYIFVSNEHPSQLDIHFDDFKVTHTPSNVVQYNEYYPYGLKVETSWTREDAKGNNYLFNAGNELNEASGWYEMFYRGYDPALGRMLQVDPLAELYSSVSGYNYALNNPVLMNDPMGDRVESQLPDYIDPESYRNGYDRPSWSQTYTDASMVRTGQMSLDSYVQKYSVATGEFKEIYGYDYSQYRVDNATLSATPLKKTVIGLGLILSPKFGMDVAQMQGGDGENSPISAYTIRGEDVNWQTLYNEFLTGDGPEYSVFGANHSMTNDLKNSWIVGIAQAEFLLRNLKNIEDGRPLEPLIMYDVPFGVVGAGMSGSNMTEQFIGGGRVSIIPTGSYTMYIVNNTTDRYSYRLHSAESIPRTRGSLTPEGTIYQRFIWIQP